MGIVPFHSMTDMMFPTSDVMGEPINTYVGGGANKHVMGRDRKTIKIIIY